MNKPTLKEQAHGEIEKIFRILLPQNGLSVREEQITLCHAMLDTLLKNNIALCDAGVGIGKTYAYLTACILLKKFAPHGPAGSQPVVISTSSVALQDSIIEEYIPFLSRIFLENRVISKPIRAIVRKGKERLFWLKNKCFFTILYVIRVERGSYDNSSFKLDLHIHNMLFAWCGSVFTWHKIMW